VQLRLLFAIAIATLIVASARVNAKPIRIAIPGFNITQIAFFVGRERGFFKDEGLDVELIQMTGTLANLALMSGEVPFTSVPTAAFSLTALAVALLSTGVVTSNSSTSLIAIVKVWSAVEPSTEVARTVTSSEASLSRSIFEPSSTVITPLVALIWKAPPASSVSA